MGTADIDAGALGEGRGAGTVPEFDARPCQRGPVVGSGEAESPAEVAGPPREAGVRDAKAATPCVLPPLDHLAGPQ